MVMSAGVYLRLMGKILDVGGMVSSEGLNGRIPRPFVVEHSGKTTMGRLGWRFMRVVRSVRSLADGGASRGYWNASSIARKRDIL